MKQFKFHIDFKSLWKCPKDIYSGQGGQFLKCGTKSPIGIVMYFC